MPVWLAWVLGILLVGGIFLSIFAYPIMWIIDKIREDRKAFLHGVGEFLLGLSILSFIIVPAYIFMAATATSSVETKYLAEDITTSAGTVVVRPNQEVPIVFYKGKSINGHWSSEGFTLVLEGYSPKVTVAKPKKRDWGNTELTVGNTKTSAFEIGGSLVIPDLPGKKPLRIKGVIQGKIVYPQPLIESTGPIHIPGEDQFIEGSSNIKVPVTLELISADDVSRKSTLEGIIQKQQHNRQDYLKLAGVFLVLGLFAIVLWRSLRA